MLSIANKHFFFKLTRKMKLANEYNFNINKTKKLYFLFVTRVVRKKVTTTSASVVRFRGGRLGIPNPFRTLLQTGSY